MLFHRFRLPTRLCTSSSDSIRRQRIFNGFAVAAASLWLAAVAAPAMAATFYVSPSGSDAAGTPGTITQPFRTVAHGEAALTQAGDTLFIRAGSYHERVNFNV